MSIARALRKAGLVVIDLYDEPWHGRGCGCKVCCLEYPPLFTDYGPLLAAEAKQRKCKRKSYKKHGCDCY